MQNDSIRRAGATARRACSRRPGLPHEPAAAVAEGLVEGDLYGHTTHGLALLADYVEEIENGGMEQRRRARGARRRRRRRDLGRAPAARRLDDDARRRRGASRRAEQLGLGAVAIRRSHHIACLAAFLEEPARAGYLVLVFSLRPERRACRALRRRRRRSMTPNPIAAGIPADPDPILIDVSMSITTAGMCGAPTRDGRQACRSKWLLDARRPADRRSQGARERRLDPADRRPRPRPQGFGLALLVEALTQGLAGYGRADGETDWGAGVLVLAFAPQRFAGADAFLRQTNWLADAARNNRAADPAKPVRLPGQLGLRP